MQPQHLGIFLSGVMATKKRKDVDGYVRRFQCANAN